MERIINSTELLGHLSAITRSQATEKPEFCGWGLQTFFEAQSVEGNDENYNTLNVVEMCEYLFRKTWGFERHMTFAMWVDFNRYINNDIGKECYECGDYWRLRYIEDILRKELGYATEVKPPSESNDVFTSAKAQEILRRAIDAGFLDNNYKPIKGKMTRAQQKMFALYAGIELGLDKPWNAFGRLFDYPNLRQVREFEGKKQKADEIKALFPKEVVAKSAYKFK